jgi:2-polyprenyl-3-methyl-5-hydroxy-6-metoxy-1,4-benzoquinol methylase
MSYRVIPDLIYLCPAYMKYRLFILLQIWVLGLTLSSCKERISQSQAENEPAHQENPADNTGFESEAKEYENPDRVIWQKPDLVIQQLGEVAGKTVADLGAGTGYFSRRIAYKGARVIAIDIDPKAIQWMEDQKSRFPIELQDRLIIRQATPSDPRLKENEVDMVLLVNTYTYIQDRVNYFGRLKKAIKKGGIVLIIDFKKADTPFGPKLEERIDINQVAHELEEAGYQIIQKDESSLEYQYILKAVRP